MTNAPLRVAIVDDEEPVRRALERVLRPVKCVVECFASGDVFLQSLADRQPDCVILDVHMPHTDGWAVLDRLSTQYPMVGVVLMTGRDSDESRQRAERAGVAYLPKPVDRGQLLEALRASVEGS